MFTARKMIRLPVAALCSGLLLSGAAQAVDWSAVPAKEIALFYPGQTSLEWMYGKREHDGAARYQKRKKDCRGCHDGDEAEYGAAIAAGGATEPAPIPGRNGHLLMKVQAANEGGNLHLRLEWPQQPTLATKQDADNASKVTVLFDDGAVEEFTAGGCWAVCHIDSKGMPAAEGEGKTKYLAESRSAMSRDKGGQDNFKSDAELQALLGSGVFLEYWQARLNPGAPAKPVHGYILSERSEYATPGISATASEAGGNWIVELSRPLGGGANQKALAPGKSYTVGFALHDQHTEGRFHLTSLQYSLQLDGGEADIVALKQ